MLVMGQQKQDPHIGPLLTEQQHIIGLAQQIRRTALKKLQQIGLPILKKGINLQDDLTTRTHEHFPTLLHVGVSVQKLESGEGRV